MQHYNRIYLVACVKRKLPRPAPARDLYTSDWFRKARQYVEQSGVSNHMMIFYCHSPE